MTIGQEQRISSLDIAATIGKPHNDVLKAIRKMEPAWQKITAGNFSLSDYTDSTGRHLPCYSLTKEETLYIATKFNDEARAKLVLRWKDLEVQSRTQWQVPESFSDALMLAAQQQRQLEVQQHQILQLTQTVTAMEKKATYMDMVFSCTETVKVKVIAQDYGMSAIAFNQLLHSFGIQYRVGDQWILYAKYLSEGYVKSVGFDYTKSNGQKAVNYTTQWTQKGRAWLYDFLKQRDFLPLIEQG